jgi:hypothetical protein
MSNIESLATGPMWAGFIAFVLAMLMLDLFVLGGNKAHRVSAREAACWTATWMALAITFGALWWWYLDGTAGREIANRKALEFFTGYLIEQALSVDNMFVFVMIFNYFAVPPELQRRVLLYGVLGAIAMRAVMSGRPVVRSRNVSAASHISSSARSTSPPGYDAIKRPGQAGAATLLTGSKASGPTNAASRARSCSCTSSTCWAAARISKGSGSHSHEACSGAQMRRSGSAWTIVSLID